MQADTRLIERAAGVEVGYIEHRMAAADDVEGRIENVLWNGHGVSLHSLRHSGMRRPNTGLLVFGLVNCPSRQQPTWMAQARNPYSRSWLWIPGSTLRVAP